MSEDENTPLVRVMVESRGRGTGSSRLAHLVTHLLANSGYRNITLLSIDEQFMHHDTLLSAEQLDHLLGLPVQVVEMCSFDKLGGTKLIGTSVENKGPTYQQIRDRAMTLFDAIKHGDEDHQDWLKEAIAAHFNGWPMPEYVAGKPKQPVAEQASKEDLATAIISEIAATNPVAIPGVLNAAGLGACEGCNYIHTHCRCLAKTEQK